MYGKFYKKISVKERLESARDLKRKSDYTAAQKTYQSILRSDPLDTQAYNRLMIIHQKRRKYAVELDVIRQAISAYRAAIVSDQQIVNDHNRIAAAISRKMAQSLGLLDENGLPVFEDPQVLAWRQHKAVVQKKLSDFLTNKLVLRLLSQSGSYVLCGIADDDKFQLSSRCFASGGVGGACR